MFNKIRFVLLALAVVVLSGCSDSDLFEPTYPLGDEISVRGEIMHNNVSRANDAGFADKDGIGVFIVDRTMTDNMSNTLALIGNHADNVCYTYTASSDSWSSTATLYWNDKTTHIDAIGYYPYNLYLASVDAYDISIHENQNELIASNSGQSGYEASDFLWAKDEDVAPGSSINLKFKHVMAGIDVRLIEGDNFDDGEWSSLSKAVVVKNVCTNASIDLSTGVVTVPLASTKSSVIAALNEEDDFRAVIPAQSVTVGTDLIGITVGENGYNFKRSDLMTYTSGKLHKFTIQVDKQPQGDYKFTLLSEAITAWDSDLISHNGQSRIYTIVNCEKEGGLKEALERDNINLTKLRNLKITGRLTMSDFETIRNIPYLESINLYDCKLVDCKYTVPEMDAEWDLREKEHYDDCIPSEAFYGMQHLSFVEFPKVLKRIGALAFRGTALTGSLRIPEGVTHIGRDAFLNWDAGFEIIMSLCGELVLPSTLEYIGHTAFRNNEFTGRLVLPENLKELHWNAFQECKYLTGEIHLPSNMTVCEGAFGDCKNLTGVVVIPPCMTTVSGFDNTSITGVKLHSGVKVIGECAFKNTKITTINLPEGLLQIGTEAFASSQLCDITFPSTLQILTERAFFNCQMLQDTIKIPESIEIIENNVFNGCRMVESIILPSKLTRIKDSAFENCYSLNHIYCKATTPPEISNNTFNGVAKDNFSVEVPESSVAAYRSDSHWNEFKRITSYSNFVARPSFANVLNKGGVRTVILNADNNWSVVDKPSWANVSPTSGYKKTELTITIDAMSHGSDERHGQITFQLSDGHTTTYDIGQYDYEYDEDQQITLQQATVGSGVDIFIVGDGYNAIDISNGTYLSDLQTEMKYFFDVEPYKTYKNYFNVYTAVALSNESGIGTLNTLRDIKFNSCVGDGLSLETRLTGETGEVVTYAKQNVSSIKSTDNLTAILLLNTDNSDGITMINPYGPCVALCTRGGGRAICQHEACGHAFGKFADEYVYHKAYINKCGCIDGCGHVAELQAAQATGIFQNVSLSGKYSDVPWRHLIFHDKYSSYVDIYEGAYFHSNGVFRSESECCMSYNMPYFSAWCRELIVRRIMQISGQQWSFENFVANDNNSVGQEYYDTSRSIEHFSSSTVGHRAPLVKYNKITTKRTRRQ
jgi:hypothetical protein